MRKNNDDRQMFNLMHNRFRVQVVKYLNDLQSSTFTTVQTQANNCLKLEKPLSLEEMIRNMNDSVSKWNEQLKSNNHETGTTPSLS